MVDNPTKSWKICDGETLPVLQWEGIACIYPCDKPHLGTIDDPFLICTVQDLVNFSNYVNSGNTTTDKYWKMINDLDLVGINWNPIGNASYYFQGHFDGNSKMISNLTINKGTTSYIGLFGCITNAEIKNLGIETCQITGDGCVGALSGLATNISTIENCYVTNGSISGYRLVGGLIGRDNYYSNLTIKNCYVIGSVTGMRDAVGGLVGGLFSAAMNNISNCYAICEVSGSYSIGGLVGAQAHYGIIDKSYACGNVQGNISVGGLVGGFGGYSGDGNLIMIDSYTTVNVSTTEASNSEIGGLTGVATSCNFTNCYATGNITIAGSSYYIGGLMGYSSDNNFTYCYATGDITVTGVSNNYTGGLLGTSNDNIANCYAIGNITTGTSNYYIGGFVGRNFLSITNCYATGNITGTGGTYFGGLVGYNFGVLRNCVAANASIIGGSSYIGRIAGTLYYGTHSHNYAYDGMIITQSGYSDPGISTPMPTLMSYNFYNTSSNWYNNIPWNIAAVESSNHIWGICDGETLPFLQWQGFSCGKSMSPSKNNEEEYIVEQNRNATFSIFPNPTSSHITISSEKDFHSIAIVDLLGRVVYAQTNNGTHSTLDVSSYCNGVYFVRIITENGAEVQKFVKR